MTSSFQSRNASQFDVGYIIEVYDDGSYEIEFSDARGATRAQIVARAEDLQFAEGVDEAP